MAEKKSPEKKKYVGRPRLTAKKKAARPKPAKEKIDKQALEESMNVRARVPGTEKMMVEDPVLTRRIKTGGFVTWQDRLAVAEIYKQMKYNLSATAKILEIDPDTVKRYSDQVNRMAVDEVKQEKYEFMLAAKKATLEAMDIKESKFIELAFDVKKQAVEQIKDLLPGCDSIRDLVAVVKVMHEVGTGRKTAEELEGEIEGKPASVLMQVAIQQLNMISPDKNNTDNGE